MKAIVGGCDRTCANCGKQFQTRRPSDKGQCCSYECMGLFKRTLPDPIPRSCAHCEVNFVPRRKLAAQRFCSNKCWLRSNHSSEHQGAAARARNVSQRGSGQKYPYVKQDGRHQHRVVAEDKIGRRLLPGEIVHHCDEDGKNNASGNLEVMTQSEHIRLHKPWQKRWS